MGIIWWWRGVKQENGIGITGLEQITKSGYSSWIEIMSRLCNGEVRR